MTRIVKWFRWTFIYAREVLRWLWKPHLTKFSLLAAVVLIGFIVIASGCLERQIRLSGMALQLLGVLTVVVGLRDSQRVFRNQPTAWQSVERWWTGRPKFGPKNVIMAVVGASVGVSTGSARGTVRAGPNTPLDGRVTILEQQYERLFDEVGQLGANFKKITGELSEALKLERTAREESDQSIKEQLVKALAEGIPLEFTGVVFFFAGIVAGTGSSEIASLFGAGSCG